MNHRRRFRHLISLLSRFRLRFWLPGRWRGLWRCLPQPLRYGWGARRFLLCFSLRIGLGWLVDHLPAVRAAGGALRAALELLNEAGAQDAGGSANIPSPRMKMNDARTFPAGVTGGACPTLVRADIAQNIEEGMSEKTAGWA